MPKLSQKSNDRVIYRCYDPSGDNGGFHEWYYGLPATVQAEIDAALNVLRYSRQPWPSTLYEKLHGACYGLAEIKIAVDAEQPEKEEGKDHYRILVFEGPRRKEITLLFGFKKENTSNYGPACRSARQRRDGVKKDGNRARLCTFP